LILLRPQLSLLKDRKVKKNIECQELFPDHVTFRQKLIRTPQLVKHL
jgi:hypothetical protein